VPTVRVKIAGRRKGAKNVRDGRGPATLLGAPPDGQSAKPDETVLNALRAWRRDEARTRAVPAFVVLHDRTIDAIARQRPRSSAELAGVPGIGPAKLAAYGDAILRVLGPAEP
jgi:ATP-dependent DNA helicase RecQ